jgi:hypothetical protein
MWGKNNLEEKLANVDVYGDIKLKYLPSTEVEHLKLRELGCTADAILIREDYVFAFEKLKGRQPNVGGIVLTGQPGIGASLLTCPAHILIT